MNMNILLIEDSKYDAELVKYHIDKKYENVVFGYAHDMDSYKAQYKLMQYDVIICDFELINCTGLDVLLDLRQHSDTPLIFVSGVLDHSTIYSKTIIAGANGYLSKAELSSIGEVMELVLSHKEQTDTERIEKLTILNKLKLYSQKALELLNQNRYAEAKSSVAKIGDIAGKLSV